MTEVVAESALEAIYPLVIFDALWVKLRDEGQVKNKAIYLALGVQVNRVKGILIAVVDGLKGFPEAINTVFPQTDVQSCIVHLIRNSLGFVGWQDRKHVVNALKDIYRAENAKMARQQLTEFGSGEWGRKYPAIVPAWERQWEHVIPFLAYPREVRRIIYTTNALESVNMRVRKIIKTRGHFPSDEAAAKLIYLALRNIWKDWRCPRGSGGPP